LWLPATGQPFAVRFASATALTGAAFALELGFAKFLGLPGLFILLSAVFLCAVLFDHGTGLYSGALAIVAGYYTLVTIHHLMLGLSGAVIFALVCALVAVCGEALRKALERAVAAERRANILLRELQHRTQNTLAIIVGLLELQARSSSHKEANDALKAAANRVRIQAEAHRHLDLKQLDKVDAGEYLIGICGLLERSLHDARPIKLDVHMQHILVDPQKALALGLITNELVTNSIKYAFRSDEAGTVSVKLDRNETGLVRLRVRDDGAGCPEKATGMGTTLIAALVKEHNGTYQRANLNKGCEVIVTLAPKPPYAAP
jgi:two-component sensor histidine kinase